MRKLILAILALAIFPGLGCDKATPTAPTGSTITVTVNPTKIEIDGTALVTALLRKGDGSAVNPGTIVFFATTLGEIDTSVPTDDGGVAEATLKGDGRVGTATITVSSGAAPDIAVDAAVQIGSLAETAVITATPSNVDFNNIPPGGAKIDLLAEVFGDNGQGLADVSVIFGTDTGKLDSRGASIQTDENGQATDVLTVNQNDLSVVGDTFFEVEILVPTDGSGDTGGVELSAFAEIDIFGVVSSVVLQATPAVLSKGGDTVTLSALVQDEGSNPVLGKGVNFTTELGSLASGGGVVQTGADGLAVDTLTVTSGDASVVGSFKVTASTTKFDGSRTTSTFTLRFQDAPIASFTTSAAANVVTVTNTSTGATTLTYLWSWGDSKPDDNFENGSHTYDPVAEPTEVFITLTVTDADGVSDSVTLSETITP